MRWFDKTNIDFIGKRKFFFYFSTALTIFGIVMTIVMGIQYGIDFIGGSEIAVEFKKPVQIEQIRNIIEKNGITGSEIKSFGEDNQYLIRTQLTGEDIKKVEEVLSREFGAENYQILKEDTIGPKIGGELRQKAFLAVIVSVIAILIYIAFRFEFTFGLGAIVALIHDVVVTFTLIVFFNEITPLNLEVNQSILAAVLTVIGYSINDTVIIFDRIRENREVHKGMPITKMINLSINETLSRTVNTVGTTMTVLVVIVFFGGPVLQGFAFTMLLGIIFGTYSSIYVASSFVIWYFEKVKKINVEGTPVKKKDATIPAKA